MIDNRLDYIADFKDGAVEKMIEYRKLFIALDAELVKLGDNCQIGHRNLVIARTHIEEALQHTIKALCLQGEKKHN